MKETCTDSILLELSKSGRAVCKNAECKKNGVKILAGELRFCNLVTIKENQSWQYKHWCVEPTDCPFIHQAQPATGVA